MLPHIKQRPSNVVSNGTCCKGNGKANKAFCHIIEYHEEVTGVGDL